LGFVATLSGPPTHEVVEQALLVLKRLSHRGAAGSDPLTGDGAGILLQIPHAYFERVLSHQGLELPLPGDYAVAQVFLSNDRELAQAQQRVCEHIVRHHNQKVIGWRDVPVDLSQIGPLGAASIPRMRQMFVARMGPLATFERSLFMIRKRVGRMVARDSVGAGFYMCSFSSKTIVYKGLMLPERIREFYMDLQADDTKSRLALVHSRFSTNTFPTWERAHPYRRIAHNGEINTLRGNQNWMTARESLLGSQAFGEHLEDFKPIIRPGGSDSASLDNVVDFLMASGRSLPHVMMMLVPEAWAKDKAMDPDLRAFYQYHAGLVEPWDGPAALVFTDGDVIGAMLDRNGLRPAKYVVTKAGLIVLSSELGVVDLEPSEIAEKGRVRPGHMFLVDTKRGRIVPDEEIKRAVSTRQNYAEWIADHRIDPASLPEGKPPPEPMPPQLRFAQQLHGYTREDETLILGPMAVAGEEPTGSMGADIALAVLSDQALPLYRYFKQQFAQVTNPPIDPIREDLVMQLGTSVGPEGNLLGETPEQCRLLDLPHPILGSAELARIRAYSQLRTRTLRAMFAESETLDVALQRLTHEAAQAVLEGAHVLVVSDRDAGAELLPIPMLLAVSAVHQHLIRSGLRARAGLIAEVADAKEVHDVALLIGFGAGAVNPYLALSTVRSLSQRGLLSAPVDLADAEAHYVKALCKGLLKVLSKMGISALSSYHGAQIFEALGISEALAKEHLGGVSTPLGGIGLCEIEADVRERFRAANGIGSDELPVGGVYAWRERGERHLWTPGSIASLQKSVRLADAASYADYAARINDQTQGPLTLRGLWDFEATRPPVPLADVEPPANIVRRFATGAMSFGSISKEAHENLAVAMNRIGGRSNTGEGGEDDARFLREVSGDSKRSAIKQVASGRFGVTSNYLVNADEIQIKMAQGAKPGEGGQLPGAKVDQVIARVRHSTPGVTLISPPPHHDIYSIEDLAQLIFDLKNVSPKARISVKLVSESGVGTVAAGVAKAHADVILIAGHDGGTGASPLSSVQHAGTPWEIGLAEAQQVLALNGLRGRVVLQADGQMKTGRDVAFAALLGAEEFGFATAPLVASGCIMMRKCHLNTCPVGIATQDPVLRRRFTGTPEHVINYFFFVAEELRGIMAQLGFRTIEEMVGRTENIRPRTLVHRHAKHLSFAKVLAPSASTGPLHNVEQQDHGLASVRDRELLRLAQPALDTQAKVRADVTLKNSDRAVGAMLGGEISRRYGAGGLPEDTIVISARGTAGQSFGAFAPKGLSMHLAGDANDYVGKGLSGGILAVFPPAEATFVAKDNVVVGNTVLYGATSGRAFLAGRAGERFAVRNSGATAVVEGVGDHACEYMTGGLVLILGSTGRNFGAGMSGGYAFVYDPGNVLATRIQGAGLELLRGLDDADTELVAALLREHVQRARSVVATALLGNLEREKAQFVKVVPVEFKKALEKLAPAQGAAPQAVKHG
jgi:glutamate synthase (NADPH/NADH) large chain